MTVWELMKELLDQNPDAEVTVKVEVKGYELPCPVCAENMGVDSVTEYPRIDDVEYVSSREVYLSVEVEL